MAKSGSKKIKKTEENITFPVVGIGASADALPILILTNIICFQIKHIVFRLIFRLK